MNEIEVGTDFEREITEVKDQVMNIAVSMSFYYDPNLNVLIIGSDEGEEIGRWSPWNGWSGTPLCWMDKLQVHDFFLHCGKLHYQSHRRLLCG